MSKKANLSYQFTSSINDSFKPGMDKHSIKKAEGYDHRIYSYSSRAEMITFSKTFAHFIKETFPDVKQVRDIDINHINSFLLSRSSNTQATIRHDITCLNKLQLCCSKKFGLDSLDWKNGRVVPKAEKETIRNIAFTEEQITKIKNLFEAKKDSYSKTAFFIAERFSLRVGEIVKLQPRDIHINTDGTGVLSIVDSKGKRSRIIEMTRDDVNFMKSITSGLPDKERIIPLRPDSVSAYLNQACKQLGFNDIVKAKTSYHALRKATIRRYYKDLIPQVGEKRARELSMIRLGHGEDRPDLAHTYLGI